MATSTVVAAQISVTWTTYAAGNNPDVNLSSTGQDLPLDGYYLQSDNSSIPTFFSFDGTNDHGILNPVSGGNARYVPARNQKKIWFRLGSAGTSLVSYEALPGR